MKKERISTKELEEIANELRALQSHYDNVANSINALLHRMLMLCGKTENNGVIINEYEQTSLHLKKVLGDIVAHIERIKMENMEYVYASPRYFSNDKQFLV